MRQQIVVHLHHRVHLMPLLKQGQMHHLLPFINI